MQAKFTLHKLFPSLLLAGMAALAAGRGWLPLFPGHGGVVAAGRAGLIGGLADWFAVTALFRHPLGLPIPHTAILPRRQARLGAALGRFVAGQVLAEEEVVRVLATADPARTLAAWLEDPARRARAAQALASGLARAARALGHPSLRRPIGRELARGARRLLAEISAPWLGRLLRSALRRERHRGWLDAILARLREILAEKEEGLKDLVRRRVREQGGRLIGWAAGAAIAGRVAESLSRELARDAGGEASPLREAAEHWLAGEAERLLHDPVRAEEVRATLSRAWERPEMRRLLMQAWRAARRSLIAGADGAAMESRVDDLLAGLARALRDPETARRCNRVAGDAAAALIPLAQPAAEALIGRVVAGWDKRGLVEKLESRLAGDLGWIRINGTVVGFLLGGALWAMGG